VSKKLRERVDELLSRERGTVFKDPGGKITVALVFPNTYHVGMSNLGFQGIYGLLNSMDDVVCERAFLPDEQDIGEYLRTGTELFSMESKRALCRFDIVAFSVSFENDYPNILRILDLGNIPAASALRKRRHPLVVMGGACAFFNPEPVADIFDICFIGEADELLGEFLARYRAAQGKEDVLVSAQSLEGVYIPSRYRIEYGQDGRIRKRIATAGAPDTIRRRYVADLSRVSAKMSIVTPDTEFSDMYLVEAMRGCPWRCRFCVASRIYHPPRMRHLDEVVREIGGALAATDRVGLIGPSLTDYPYVHDILRIPGVNFSVTSLRAGEKACELSPLMAGHRSVSIAPEAGTDRLRKVINKKMSEEDILRTAQALFGHGVENLRLYFMVGLPAETREDVAGIVDLTEKIRASSAKGILTLSVSTFVPKPFTPFQWHPMEKIAEVKERLTMIKKALAHRRGIRVFHDVPKYAYLQGLLSRGDRRVLPLLSKMRPGEDWRKAAAAAGVDIDFYIFRERDTDEILPWDFIDMGVAREQLWREYREAVPPRDPGNEV